MPCRSILIDGGYDVSVREFVSKNAVNLMCLGCNNEQQEVCLDNNTFNFLFEKFVKNSGLIKNSEDPELLVLSGYIHKGGTVEFRETARVAEGVASVPQSDGAYSVALIDKSGELIHETPFHVSFTLSASGAEGTALDTFPFVIAVPYLADTAKVLLKDTAGDITLAEINPHSETLRDIINSIPPNSFITGAPEKKKANLLRIIDRFEDNVSKGKSKQAINDLTLLKRQTKIHTKTEFVSEFPFEYTKAEILAAIEREIELVK